jgi:hypothetical protein
LQYDPLGEYTYLYPQDNQVGQPNQQEENQVHEQQYPCKVKTHDLQMRIFVLLMRVEFVFASHAYEVMKHQDVNVGMFHMYTVPNIS